MIIKSAEFITSAVKPDQYPETVLPEIAFAGRSNVGKSSLINTLINRKNLVKTSQTPGKTRLINFFRINDQFVFVDLPGYGYAKVSATERKQWGPMVEKYLNTRPGLKGLMILQDIRRMPGKEEHELVSFLNHLDIPFFYIFTKADKLSKNKQIKQVRSIRDELLLNDEEFICFSAKTRQGRDRTWQQIGRLLELDTENGPTAGENTQSNEIPQR